MQTTPKSTSNGTAQAGAPVQAPASEHTRDVPVYLPRIDIFETPAELVVLADVPGASQNDIDIKFENRTLTMYARVPHRWPRNASWLSGEYDIGDFERTFEVENGVLTVRLPKAEAARPRKIQVRGK